MDSAADLLNDPRHVQLVEWLVTPPSERTPSTQSAFAETVGVSPRTIRDWMARDDVRRAWTKRSNEVVGDPSNIQEVLEEMRAVALDRTDRKQVQAAKLYLEAVDAIKPPDRSVEVKVTSDLLSTLSDEELEARIAETMAMRKAEEILGAS